MCNWKIGSLPYHKKGKDIFWFLKKFFSTLIMKKVLSSLRLRIINYIQLFNKEFNKLSKNVRKYRSWRLKKLKFRIINKPFQLKKLKFDNKDSQTRRN